MMVLIQLMGITFGMILWKTDQCSPSSNDTYTTWYLIYGFIISFGLNKDIYLDPF